LRGGHTKFASRANRAALNLCICSSQPVHIESNVGLLVLIFFSGFHAFSRAISRRLKRVLRLASATRFSRISVTADSLYQHFGLLISTSGSWGYAVADAEVRKMPAWLV
jgi:hypothetical protein